MNLLNGAKHDLSKLHSYADVMYANYFCRVYPRRIFRVLSESHFFPNILHHVAEFTRVTLFQSITEYTSKNA